MLARGLWRGATRAGGRRACGGRLQIEWERAGSATDSGSVAIGVVASAATHAQDLCFETVGTLQFSGHASGKVAKKVGRISLRGPWVVESLTEASQGHMIYLYMNLVH